MFGFNFSIKSGQSLKLGHVFSFRINLQSSLLCFSLFCFVFIIYQFYLTFSGLCDCYNLVKRFIFYKSQIKPKIEHCCHVRAGVAKSNHSRLDRVQKHQKALLFTALQPFSYRQNITYLSLVYCYIHGQCSGELHSSVLAFTANTCHVHRDELFPFLHIPLVKPKFHLDSFFPRTAILWNKPQRGCTSLNMIILSFSNQGQSLSITLVFIIFTSYHLLIHSLITHFIHCNSGS